MCPLTKNLDPQRSKEIDRNTKESNPGGAERNKWEKENNRKIKLRSKMIDNKWFISIITDYEWSKVTGKKT